MLLLRCAASRHLELVREVFVTRESKICSGKQKCTGFASIPNRVFSHPFCYYFRLCSSIARMFHSWCSIPSISFKWRFLSPPRHMPWKWYKSPAASDLAFSQGFKTSISSETVRVRCSSWWIPWSLQWIKVLKILFLSQDRKSGNNFSLWFPSVSSYSSPFRRVLQSWLCIISWTQS